MAGWGDQFERAVVGLARSLRDNEVLACTFVMVSALDIATTLVGLSLVGVEGEFNPAMRSLMLGVGLETGLAIKMALATAVALLCIRIPMDPWVLQSCIFITALPVVANGAQLIWVNAMLAAWAGA